MNFDPASPHFYYYYVIGAYGLLAVFLLGFALHGVAAWRGKSGRRK